MSIFKRLFRRPASRQELERDYLNQSVSRYDLERREREIAQGKFALGRFAQWGMSAQTRALCQP